MQWVFHVFLRKMKVIVGGIAAEYQDEGSGLTLLFLHGWKDDLHTFDRLVRLFVPPYRTVRIDLPGFGQTETPQCPWRLEDYVRFVDDFLRKLNIRPLALVGHSFGGRVLIKGVSAGILKPQKIVLIDSAGIAKSCTLKNRLLTLAAKIGKAATFLPPFVFWRKEIRRKLYEKIGSDYFAAGALKDTFLTIIREDLTGAASNIACPVLLLWGADDSVTPVADGRRLSHIIPHASLNVIEGAGHFVHREKPEEVAALIKKFLQDLRD